MITFFIDFFCFLIQAFSNPLTRNYQGMHFNSSGYVQINHLTKSFLASYYRFMYPGIESKVI